MVEKKKQKKEIIKCTYCGKNSFYLYRRDKKGKIKFAICFDCFKKAFDKLLGEAKDGGRIYTD